MASIFLGPNDIFSFDDDSIDPGIDDIRKHLDQLVTMIRDASPSTHIALLLPVPPAASQDAFGSNYASGQTRWQYRRNQHRLVERMLERYASPSPEPPPRVESTSSPPTPASTASTTTRRNRSPRTPRRTSSSPANPTASIRPPRATTRSATHSSPG